MAFNIKPPMVHELKCADATTLQEGMILFADPTQSLVSDQEVVVTQATISNVYGAAYLVHHSSGGQVCTSTAPGRITGIPVTERAVTAVYAYTDQTVTAGDWLGPQPGSYYMRRGVFFTGWGLRVRTTPSTQGTASAPVRVLCDAIPQVPESELLAFHQNYYNDFAFYTTVHNGLTTVADSTGASAAADTVNGNLTITTAAADNDTQGVIGTKKNWQLAANKPLYFAAKVTPTVVGAGSTNIIVGLQDKAGTTTTTLQADGAGIAASIDAAAFVHLEGAATWKAAASRTTVQLTATGSAAFATATAYKLEMLYDGGTLSSSGSGKLFFWVDGVLIETVTMTTSGPIPSGVMALTILDKSTGSAEILNVDFVKVRQVR